jgi:hypothetical protein
VFSYQYFGGWTENCQMHTRIFLSEFFYFFKMHLKYIFIIGVFAPLSHLDQPLCAPKAVQRKL